jgi:hypothetical protein
MIDVDYQTALEAYRAYKACRLHLASIGLSDPDVDKREQDWRRKAYGEISKAGFRLADLGGVSVSA